MPKYHDFVVATQVDERSIRIFVPCIKLAHEEEALKALKDVAYDYALENATARFVSVSNAFPVRYDGNLGIIGYGCIVAEETDLIEIRPEEKKLN